MASWAHYALNERGVIQHFNYGFVFNLTVYLPWSKLYKCYISTTSFCLAWKITPLHFRLLGRSAAPVSLMAHHSTQLIPHVNKKIVLNSLKKVVPKFTPYGTIISCDDRTKWTHVSTYCRVIFYRSRKLTIVCILCYIIQCYLSILFSQLPLAGE